MTAAGVQLVRPILRRLGGGRIHHSIPALASFTGGERHPEAHARALRARARRYRSAARWLEGEDRECALGAAEECEAWAAELRATDSLGGSGR
jgi:hypothetical protein